MRIPSFTAGRAMLVAGAVGFPAYALTATLIGQAPEPTAPVAVPAGETVAMDDRVAAPGVPEGPAPPADPGTTREVAFRSMDVRVQGRLALVTGAASVLDREPGNRYVWTVRVYGQGPGRPHFHERHYVESALMLGPGEVEADPEFADAIELPPGDHKVELILSAGPAGFDYRTVPPGGDLRDHGLSRLRRSRRVAIE